MKTTVIFHSADYDGIFCREIARKFLPDAELIGWNFGDAPLGAVRLTTGDPIYVLDLPVDKVFGCSFSVDQTKFPFPMANIIWIDHHKSSIESHPKELLGYRIDGVAACRLAWQWFCNSFNNYGAKSNFGELSFISGLTKQHFVDRMVNEPLAVRLAGEYDIWDKRDPNAELFQHGLRSQEISENLWDLLLVNQSTDLPETELHGKRDVGTIAVEALLERGEAVQYAKTKENESICNHQTWIMEWEGLKFLCVNHARFNSLLFDAKDKPETGHDALLGFKFDGKAWTVSLYHAKHRTDLDLSAIAVKHGGGGHRGAAGMTFTDLPPFLKTS